MTEAMPSLRNDVNPWRHLLWARREKAEDISPLERSPTGILNAAAGTRPRYRPPTGRFNIGPADVPIHSPACPASDHVYDERFNDDDY